MLNHVEQLFFSSSHFVKMPIWFWYEGPSLSNPLVQFQHVNANITYKLSNWIKNGSKLKSNQHYLYPHCHNVSL
jgi:hypothetical protein